MLKFDFVEREKRGLQRFLNYVDDSERVLYTEEIFCVKMYHDIMIRAQGKYWQKWDAQMRNARMY